MWAVGIAALWGLAMIFWGDGDLAAVAGIVGLLLSGFVVGNLQEHKGLFG